MLNWSNVAYKFTLGIGSLGFVALIAEFSKNVLSVWVVVPVVLVPLIAFVCVRSGEGPHGWVRAVHVGASIWYLLLAVVLSAMVLTTPPPPRGWPLFLVFVWIGSVPCMIVLLRAVRGRYALPTFIVFVSPPAATVDDLIRTEGKAELIAGRIVCFPPHGHFPAVLAGRIRRSLDDDATTTGRGEAYGSTTGFVFPSLANGRESFCPDAAYYTGPLPDNPMGFLPGPPDFAVEVRSENDYGPAAEQALADKRADYFEAGTRVVWDVDPIAGVVRRYRPGEAAPTEFATGTTVDAEPAVPGWSLAVDALLG